MVLGHGGNTTVIKTTATWQEDSLRFAGCWHNWFSGILNEPGPGSKPYDLDPFSYATTILGHQNTVSTVYFFEADFDSRLL